MQNWCCFNPDWWLQFLMVLKALWCEKPELKCFLFFLIHSWNFRFFCPMPKTTREIFSSWYFGFGIRSCRDFAYCTGIVVPSAHCTSLVLLLQILVLAHVFLRIPLLKPYLKSPLFFCSYGYYLNFNLPYYTLLCWGWWWYFSVLRYEFKASKQAFTIPLCICPMAARDLCFSSG